MPGAARGWIRAWIAAAACAVCATCSAAAPPKCPWSAAGAWDHVAGLLVHSSPVAALPSLYVGCPRSFSLLVPVTISRAVDGDEAGDARAGTLLLRPQQSPADLSASTAAQLSLPAAASRSLQAFIRLQLRHSLYARADALRFGRSATRDFAISVAHGASRPRPALRP